MKKLFIAILTLAVLMSMAFPVFAYEYGFESGASTLPGFGKPTSNDDPVSPDPMSQNERRNKDNSALPPPYFYGSGDIPTGPSSLYHDNLPGGASAAGAGSVTAGNGASYGGPSTISVSQDGMLPSTSTFKDAAYNTEPRYYADGSIGTLYIENIKKTIKVYEGESLENLKKGIGHFEFTSAWDGNCCFAGHNRGAAAYFSFVKDLTVGDRIVYTTPYGSRVYEVYNKTKISETDYTGLGWSAENIISMITCVADEPAYRWLVQAKEVK
jgi:sortase A